MDDTWPKQLSSIGELPASLHSDIDGDLSLIPGVSDEEARQWVVVAIRPDGRRQTQTPSEHFVGYAEATLNWYADFSDGTVFEVSRPGRGPVYVPVGRGSRAYPPHWTSMWTPVPPLTLEERRARERGGPRRHL